jgi:hypothetical protein
VAKQLTGKLVVILHADVVGSTVLVQRDERRAHERITSAFQRFSQTIQEYGGQVHEIRGDALLAEFARASDAVCATLAFQQGNTAHNKTLDDDILPVAGDNYFFRWRQLKVLFLRPRYGIFDLHFSFSARFVRVRLFAASAR